jgi:hypothetical protein
MCVIQLSKKDAVTINYDDITYKCFYSQMTLLTTVNVSKNGPEAGLKPFLFTRFYLISKGVSLFDKGKAKWKPMHHFKR